MGNDCIVTNVVGDRKKILKKEWIEKNGIEVNHLVEALLENFYATNQLIKGK